MARPKDSGIDDSARLDRMADGIIERGCLRTLAAREVLKSENESGPYLKSATGRLVRKFREAGADGLLSSARQRAARATGEPLRVKNPTLAQRREHARAMAQEIAQAQKSGDDVGQILEMFQVELQRQGGHWESLAEEIKLKVVREILRGPIDHEED